jgi:hypothetical protein
MPYGRGLTRRGHELLVQKSRVAFILNFSLPLFLYPTHFKPTSCELSKNTRKSGQIKIASAGNSLQRQMLFMHQEGGGKEPGKSTSVFLCSKNENNDRINQQLNMSCKVQLYNAQVFDL